jgi:hypothetical protein
VSWALNYIATLLFLFMDNEKCVKQNW